MVSGTGIRKDSNKTSYKVVERHDRPRSERKRHIEEEKIMVIVLE